MVTVTSPAPKLLILLNAEILLVATQSARVLFTRAPSLKTTASTFESRATAKAAKPGTAETVTLAPLKFEILFRVAA